MVWETCHGNPYINLYDTLNIISNRSSFEDYRSFCEKRINQANIDNDKIAEGLVYLSLSFSEGRQRKFEEAFRYLEKAEKIAKKSKSPFLFSRTYLSYGNIYNIKKETTDAIKYYTKSLNISKEHQDTLIEIKSLSNIATLLSYQQQWKNSITNFQEVIEKATLIKSTDLVASAYFNMGICYRALKNTDSTYICFSRSRDLSKRVNNNYLYALSLVGLGTYYNSIQNVDQALLYNHQALRLAEKMGYKHLIVECKSNLLFCELYAKNYSEVLKKSEELLNIIDSSNVKKLYDISYVKAISYIMIGEKTKAVKEINKTLDYIAQGHDLDSRNYLSFMDAKYNAQQKELEIESLNKQKKTFIIIFIIGALLLISVIIILLQMMRNQKLRQYTRLEATIKEKKFVAAQALLNGENKERARIAKEIHDGLGGLLTMARLNLVQYEEATEKDPQKIKSSITILENSIKDMRRMAHNLMPESLSRFGLKPVLEDYCKGSEYIYFNFYGNERRFDEKIEINIYRIVCELINNALKHSGATKINVQLVISDDRLSVTVEDNGKGFDTKNSKYLRTVRSRTDLIGATLDLISEEGNGTEINIEKKLNND